MPDESNIQKEELVGLTIQGHSPSWWGKSWRTKPEAADYIVYPIRKQSECLCTVHFQFLLRDPSPWNGTTAFRVGLDTSVDLIQVISHRHPGRGVPMATLNPLELAIKINHNKQLPKSP